MTTRAPTSTPVHQHDPGTVDGRDPEGQLRPPRDADGDGAGRLHALAALPALRPGRSDLAQPGPLRALRGSCLDAALVAAPPAGVQAVDPDYEVSASRRSPSRTSRPSASSARAAPATPSTAGPAASRRRPGRSARGWPPRSAWRSPASGWPTRYNRDGIDAVRLRRLRPGRRRLHDGGHLLGGRLARRPPAACQPLLDLRLQPHHDRGPHRLAFTEDVAARFIAYGWNVTTVADANDLDAVARAFQAFKAEHERPTLILVHSHIGYGSPVEDTPKAHGEPLGVEGVRATKRFLGMPEDAEFFVPDGVCERFADGRRRARRRGARRLGGAVRALPAPSTPTSPTRSSGCSAASCPTAGTTRCPTFARRREGDRHPQGLRPGAQRDGRRPPVADRRLRRPSPSTKTRLTFDGAGDFEPGDYAGPQAPLRHPRARVGGDRQRHGR